VGVFVGGGTKKTDVNTEDNVKKYTDNSFGHITSVLTGLDVRASKKELNKHGIDNGKNVSAFVDDLTAILLIAAEDGGTKMLLDNVSYDYVDGCQAYKLCPACFLLGINSHPSADSRMQRSPKVSAYRNKIIRAAFFQLDMINAGNASLPENLARYVDRRKSMIKPRAASGPSLSRLVEETSSKELIPALSRRLNEDSFPADPDPDDVILVLRAVSSLPSPTLRLLFSPASNPGLPVLAWLALSLAAVAPAPPLPSTPANARAYARLLLSVLDRLPLSARTLRDAERRSDVDFDKLLAYLNDALGGKGEGGETAKEVRGKRRELGRMRVGVGAAEGEGRKRAAPPQPAAPIPKKKPKAAAAAVVKKVALPPVPEKEEVKKEEPKEEEPDDVPQWLKDKQRKKLELAQKKEAQLREAREQERRSERAAEARRAEREEEERAREKARSRETKIRWADQGAGKLAVLCGGKEGEAYVRSAGHRMFRETLVGENRQE
jgi:hypothetical protein